jgi:hypothetical protein
VPRRSLCALCLFLLAACGGSVGPKAASVTSTWTSSTTTSASFTTTTSTTIATTTTRKSTTTSAPPAAATSEPYVYSVATVTAADLGASWHDGCPVGPSQLRMLTLSFIGFDDAERTGQLVVNQSVVDDVVQAFREMHAARFPIRKMKPIFTQAEYDDYETPDDNSAGFSCRNAVNSSGTPSWSEHAYGRAIDINPIENPYIEGGRVIPSAGAAYTDRSDVRPGMAVTGSAIVRAFADVGWGWGASFNDYQHFSSTGR